MIVDYVLSIYFFSEFPPAPNKKDLGTQLDFNCESSGKIREKLT